MTLLLWDETGEEQKDLPQSCTEILDEDSSSDSGVYMIDPDGSGGLDPFKVYCDMDTAGGGWTLVGHKTSGVEPDFTSSVVYNNSSGHDKIFSDSRWEALVDISEKTLSLEPGTSNWVENDVAGMLGANCKSLSLSLLDGKMVHQEDAGCDGTGTDYCLWGSGGGSISRQTYHSDYCSNSFRTGASGDGASSTWEPGDMWIYVKGFEASDNTTDRTVSVTGTETSTEWSEYLYDGVFSWNVEACDGENNCDFAVSNYTLEVDTENPVVEYTPNTPDDGEMYERDHLFVEVTVQENNFENITYRLFREGQKYNETTFETEKTSINWTGLSKGSYSYNVTVFDKAGNTGKTSTRDYLLETIFPKYSDVSDSSGGSATEGEQVDVSVFWKDYDSYLSSGRLFFNGSGSFEQVNSKKFGGSGEISEASYTGETIGTADGNPVELFWKPDGTMFWEVGWYGDLHEWEVSEPWDISTASTTGKTASVQGNPFDMYWRSDGEVFWVIENTGESIHEYVLSTPWDIDTISHNGSISAQDSDPKGIFWKSDGTKFYEAGRTNLQIYEWECSTPWTLASCSSTGETIPAQDSDPTGLFWSSSGERFWEVGRGDSDIYEYDCSTPWELSTCSHSGVTFTTQSSRPVGLAWKPDLSKFWDIGYDSQNINEYTLPATNSSWFNSTLDTGWLGNNYVCWRQEANDTEGNLNKTMDEQCFSVQEKISEDLIISLDLSRNSIFENTLTDLFAYGNLNYSNSTPVGNNPLNFYLDDQKLSGADSFDPGDYSNVVYVDSAEGDDSTGDGSSDNPYQSLPEALNHVSSGDAVKFSEGQFNVTQSLDIPVDNLTLWGEQLGTEINIPSGTGYQVTGYDGYTLKVYNLIWSFPDRFLNHDNHALKAYNSVFRTQPDSGTNDAPYFIYNNFGGSYLENCLVYSQDSGGGNPSQVIIGGDITFNNSYYKDYEDGTTRYSNDYVVDNSIIRDEFVDSATSLGQGTPGEPSVDSEQKITLDESLWRDTGNGEDPDGSQADIGVYGGRYAWGVESGLTDENGSYNSSFSFSLDPGQYSFKVNSTKDYKVAENTRTLDVIKGPNITSEIIYPDSPFTWGRNRMFNTSIAITCNDYDCGNVSTDFFFDGQVIEGFEDGIGRWDVFDSDFQIFESPIWRGDRSAGIDEGYASNHIAELPLSGVKPSKFEFYYYETSSSTGGGLSLMNEDGNREVTFATDNPQWEVYDSGGVSEIGSAGEYQVWVRVNATFDWDNNQYTVTFNDTSDTDSTTHTGGLRYGKEFTGIMFDNYGSGPDYTGDCTMWLDDIMYFDSFKVSNQTRKTSIYSNSSLPVYTNLSQGETKTFNTWFNLTSPVDTSSNLTATSEDMDLEKNTDSQNLMINSREFNYPLGIEEVSAEPLPEYDTRDMSVAVNVSDRNTGQVFNCTVSGDISGSSNTTVTDGYTKARISLGQLPTGTYDYNVSCFDYSWNSTSDKSLNNQFTVETAPELRIDIIHPGEKHVWGQNYLFNATVNVTCLYNNCGNVSHDLFVPELTFFEDWEDGTGDWDILDSGFGQSTSRVYGGTYSAGITDSGADNVIANHYLDSLGENPRPETFEFYFNEDSSSTGGGFAVINSDGEYELGLFTDNPEWEIWDAGGTNQIGDANDFDVWTRVNVSFDWENTEYTVTYDDLGHGDRVTHTGTLAHGKDFDELRFMNYNGGSLTYSGGLYMWVDNITVGSDTPFVTTNRTFPFRTNLSSSESVVYDTWFNVTGPEELTKNITFNATDTDYTASSVNDSFSLTSKEYNYRHTINGFEVTPDSYYDNDDLVFNINVTDRNVDQVMNCSVYSDSFFASSNHTLFGGEDGHDIVPVNVGETPPGTYDYNITCHDYTWNRSTVESNFHQMKIEPHPVLEIEKIHPPDEDTVLLNESFNYTFNVSCTNNDCGPSNISIVERTRGGCDGVPVSGYYMIDLDGDGPLEPTNVSCVVDDDGEGWMNVSMEGYGDDKILSTSYSSTNGVDKCGGEAKYFDGRTDITTDFSIGDDTNRTYDINYSTGGNSLSEAEEKALRDNIIGYSNRTRSVSYTCDDDGRVNYDHDNWLSNGTSKFLTTDGYVDGSDYYGWWLHHHNVSDNYFEAESSFTGVNESRTLEPSYILPDNITQRMESGGGVAWGYEKKYVLLKTEGEFRNVITNEEESSPFRTNKSSTPFTVNLSQGEHTVQRFFMNTTGYPDREYSTFGFVRDNDRFRNNDSSNFSNITLKRYNFEPEITGLGVYPDPQYDEDFLSIVATVQDDNLYQNIECEVTGDFTGTTFEPADGGEANHSLGIGYVSPGTYSYNITCTDDGYGNLSDYSLNNQFTVEASPGLSVTRVFPETGSVNWIRNGTNRIRLNVSCTGNDCGEVRVGVNSSEPVLGDGSDGSLTVTDNRTVNNYTYIAGEAESGDSEIPVSDLNGFEPGDEIMLHQTQNGTGRGTAGGYEYRHIDSIFDKSGNIHKTFFEDGSAGGWIVDNSSCSGSGVGTSDGNVEPYGDYYLRLLGNDEHFLNIDISHIEDPVLNFSLGSYSMDSTSENADISVYDGEQWVRVARSHNEPMNNFSIDLSEYRNPDFRVKFDLVDGNGCGDYGYLDNVTLSGRFSTMRLSRPLNKSYYSYHHNSTDSETAQIVRVPQFTNLTIEDGGAIVPKEWDGFSGGILTFRVQNQLETVGSGVIDAGGAGYRGGDCNGCGDTDWGDQGEGYTGIGEKSIERNGMGGGGGYGGNALGGEPGAGGGHATFGGIGNTTDHPSEGGSPAGEETLERLFFGGGGGGGGDNDGNTPYPVGGDGGGIIRIFANRAEDVNITVDGEDGKEPSGAGSAESGSGAGGSVYVTAGQLGVSNVSALGGRETNSTWEIDETGGNGSFGRIRFDRLNQTGSSNPPAYERNLRFKAINERIYDFGGSLVPTGFGYPFYTNRTNPYMVNLSSGEFTTVDFWFNSTGIAGVDYRFTGGAVDDDREKNSDTVEALNVTLQDYNFAPSINDVTVVPETHYEHENLTIEINVTDLNRYQEVRCDVTGDISGSNTLPTNAGYMEIPVNIGYKSPGTYSFDVTCTDTSWQPKSDVSSGNVLEVRHKPGITVELLDPIGPVEWEEETVHRVDYNVSCTGNDCGDVNFSVSTTDPVFGDGTDGDAEINSTEVVNSYTHALNNVSIGDNEIQVGDTSPFKTADLVLVHQVQNASSNISAGKYVYKRVFDVGNGEMEFFEPFETNFTSGKFNQTGARTTQIVRIPEYQNVDIYTNGTVTAKGWDGFSGGIAGFRAQGDVVFHGDGSINVTGKGYRGGDCNGCGNSDWGDQGESYLGLGEGELERNAIGGGGGYGPTGEGGEPGAGGGHATPGEDGVGDGSTSEGGSTVGDEELSRMFFGGGGGAGGDNDNIEPFPQYRNGGGIALVSAKNVSNAMVYSEGMDGLSEGSSAAGSAGGGAGGTVWFKSDAVDVRNISVKGGNWTYGDGIDDIAGAGGDGRIRMDYDTSFDGGTYPEPYVTGFDTSEFITNIPGDEPFFTNKSESPYTITLANGSSQQVSFWLNATGELNKLYSLSGYGNDTDSPSEDYSQELDVRITPEPFNWTFRINGSEENIHVEPDTELTSEIEVIVPDYGDLELYQNDHLTASVEDGSSISFSELYTTNMSYEMTARYPPQGYYTEKNITRYITVGTDNTPPEITLLEPLSVWLDSGDVEFTYTVEDNFYYNLTCEHFVDGDSQGTVENVTQEENRSFALNGISDDVDHTWSVECTDDNGNTGVSTNGFFNVDTTKPYAELSYPENGSLVYDITPTLTVNSSDNLSPELEYRLYVDGSLNSEGTVGTGLQNISAAEVSPGNHTFMVSVTDSAGNSFNSSVINFTVGDSYVELVSPERDSYVTNSSVNFAYMFVDENFDSSECSLYIDGTLERSESVQTSTQIEWSVEDAPEMYDLDWSVECETPEYSRENQDSFNYDPTSPVVEYISVNPAHPANYSVDGVEFDVRVEEPVELENVVLQENFTGADRNTTLSCNSVSSTDYVCSEGYSVPVGDYEYNVFVNNSFNLSNSTEISSYDVSRDRPELELKSNSEWEIPTDKISNVSCTSGNQESNLTLWRNGTLVNHSVGMVYDVGRQNVSYYEYICNSSETQNFTAYSVENYLNVTEQSLDLVATPDWNITYGPETTVECSIDYNDTAPRLYLEGSQVPNPYSKTHAVGSYNYTCIVDATPNHPGTRRTDYLNVEKADDDVNILFDGSEGDRTVTYGETVEVDAESVTVIDKVLRNGTEISVPVNESLAAGYYEYFANSTGDQNYSSSESYSYLEFEKRQPSISLTAQPQWEIIKNHNATVNCSLAPEDGETNISLYREGVLQGTGDSSVVREYNFSQGEHDFVCNTTETQNFTNTSLNNTVIAADRAGTILDMEASTGWRVTNGTQTNVSCDANHEEAEPVLWVDGKNVSNPFVTTHQVGDYSYTCNISQTENYKNESVEDMLDVKFETSCNLEFEPETGKYGENFTTDCSCTSSAVEKLWRDGEDVSDENEEPVSLPQGTYNYVCNVSESDDYTAAENSSEFTVEDADSAVELYLDGSRDDIEVDQFTEVNVSSRLIVPENGTLHILVDGSEVWLEDSPAQLNYSFESAGSFNVTTVFEGDENYGRAQESFNVNISDDEAPEINIISPEEGYWTNSSNNDIEFTVEDYQETVDCNLSVNGTLEDSDTFVTGQTASLTADLVDGRNFGLTVTCDDGLNHSSNASTSLNVDQEPPFANITEPAGYSETGDPTPDITAELSDNLAEELSVTVHTSNATNLQGTRTTGENVFTLNPLPRGLNDVRIEVEDLAGNSFTSDRRTINLSGTLVYLERPVFDQYLNSSDVDFVFNYSSDDIDMMNCSLYVDSELRQFEESVPEGNSTTLTETGFEDGSGYSWTVLCNSSEVEAENTGRFNVDTTPPVFENMSADPVSNEPFRYNETVFNANVSDNLGVERVVIQHNFTDDGSFVNTTMDCSEGENVSCSFSEVLPQGNYSYNYFAFDRAGNMESTIPVDYNVGPGEARFKFLLEGNNTDVVVDQGENVEVFTRFLEPEKGTVYIKDNGREIGKCSEAQGCSFFRQYFQSGVHNMSGTFFSTFSYTKTVKWHRIIVRGANITFISPTPDDGALLEDESSVGIAVNTRENLSTAYLNWNGSSLPMDIDSNEADITLNTTESGVYEYSVSVEDENGNRERSATRNFTVLNIAPNISFEQPTPDDGDVVYNDSFLVNASISEGNLEMVNYTWENNVSRFLNPGTIAYYGFDNNPEIGDSATVAADQSKPRNDGLISGASYQTGRYGNGLYFDGLNDYVDTQLTTADVLGTNRELTYETWMRSQYNDNSDAFIGTRYFNDFLLTNVDGDLAVYFAAPRTTTVRSDVDVFDNEWHHVAATWDSGTVSLYVDGEMVERDTGHGYIDTSGQSIGIGAEPSSNRRYYRGMLDEPRIHGKALSENDIRGHYKGNLRKVGESDWRLLYNQTGLVPGETYTYGVEALDTAGLDSSNYRSVERTGVVWNFTLNDRASNIHIEPGESVELKVDLFEPDSGNLSLYRDGQKVSEAIQGESVTFTASGFTEPGAYNITAVFAEEGNYPERRQTRFINVGDDVEPPEIGFDLPGNGSWINFTEGEFEFTPTDNFRLNLTCEPSVNSVSYGNLTDIVPGTKTGFNVSGLPNSTNQSWSVRCWDNASLSNEEFSRFHVDITDPVVSIETPVNGTYTTDVTPEIGLNTSDDRSTELNYTVLVDGGKNSEGTVPTGGSNITLDSLDSGNYSVRVMVTDSAGNSDITAPLEIQIGQVLELYEPVEGFNTSERKHNYSFKFIDENFEQANCSLRFNETLDMWRIINTSERYNYTSDNLSEGLGQSWSISCDTGEYEISRSRSINTDYTAPGYEGFIARPGTPRNYSETDRTMFRTNLTDEVGFDGLVVQHDFNGTAENMSVACTGNRTFAECGFSDLLEPGNYSYRYFGNDSFGNTNASRSFNYTVNRAVPVITMSSDKRWSVVSGTEVNVSCSTQNNTEISLFRDGDFVGSDNAGRVSDIMVHQDTTVYTCNTTESSLYRKEELSRQLEVLNNTEINLSSAPGWDIVYGQESNVSCSLDHDETVPTLRRNETPIDNPDVEELDAGIYNYSCEAEKTENHVYNRTWRLLDVSKSGDNVTVLVDGKDANRTVVYGRNTSVDTDSMTGTEELYVDGEKVPSPVKRTFPAGNHTLIANSTGTDNYLPGRAVRNLWVRKSSPEISLESSPQWSILNGTAATVNCSVKGSNDETVLNLYRDDELVNSSYGWVSDSDSYDLGNHTYICNSSESQNYSSQEINNTLRSGLKADAGLGMTAVPGWNVTQGTVTTVECEAGNNESVPEMWVDGSNVSNPYTVSHDVGNHDYVCNSTSTEYYRSENISETLDVKYETSCSLGFVPQNSVGWGEEFYANCSCSSAETDERLYREGVDVTSENVVNTSLGMGNYTYTCNVSRSDNYTNASTAANYSVTRRETVLGLKVDNRTGEVSVDEGFSNISSKATGPDSAEIAISLNGSEIWRQNSPLSTEYEFEDPGFFSLESYYPGDERYKPAETRVNITVNDSTRPVFTLLQPDEGYWHNSETLNVDYRVEDISEPLECVLKVNGVEADSDNNVYQDTDNRLTASGLSEGRLQPWSINCTDTRNNSREVSRNINVDTTPPKAEITSPEETLNTSDPTPEITVNMSDNFGEDLDYIVYVDGGVNTRGYGVPSGDEQNITLSRLSRGMHEVSVMVEDEAGNSNTTDTFLINVSGNIVNLFRPVRDEYLDYRNVTFGYNFSSMSEETLNCSYYVNGSFEGFNGTVLEGQNTFFELNNMSEGERIPWNVTCRNGDGVSGDSSVFSVDVTPPVIERINATPGDGSEFTVNNTSFEANFTENINFSHAVIQHDFGGNLTNDTMECEGEHLANCSFSHHLIVGDFNYRIFGFDSAGNSVVSENRTHVVNKTGPGFELLLDGNSSDIVANQGEFVEIFTRFDSPEKGTIYIYEDDSRIGSCSKSTGCKQFRSYSEPGVYNISTVFYSTVTFTKSVLWHTITIRSANLTFVEPTPPNGSQVYNNWAVVKVTGNRELDDAVLRFNDSSKSMNIDGDSAEINLTGLRPWKSYNYSVTIEDVGGNSETRGNRSFMFNNSLPGLEFVEPTPEDDGVRYFNNASINVTTELNLSSARIFWNGSWKDMDINEDTASFTAKDLPTGDYSYRVDVKDYLGRNETSENRSLEIRKRPGVTGYSGPYNITVDAEERVREDENVDANITFHNLNEDVGSTVTLQYWVENETGNVVEGPNTESVFVDAGSSRKLGRNLPAPAVRTVARSESGGFSTMADDTQTFYFGGKVVWVSGEEDEDLDPFMVELVNETDNETDGEDGGAGGDEGPGSGPGGGGFPGQEPDDDDECTFNWSCTDWSRCLDKGIQKRICINEGTCNGTEGKPNETQECKVEKEVKPFNMSLNLSSSIYADASNLTATTVFEEFQNITRKANISYTIRNSTGHEVFFKEGEVEFRGRRIVSEDFEGLRLPPGNYTLTLGVQYREDGQIKSDSVDADFSIKGEEPGCGRYYISATVRGVVLLMTTAVLVLLVLVYRKEKDEDSGWGWLE